MYQALYRKYRPKNFKELLGQNHITTTLKHQVERENIGHAYLFSGTRGTGKTSAAKILSRAVNCLDPENGEPCNKCENCISILEDTTMDVIEMDAASNNSVDDIRDLRDKVVYPPSKLKYKVYIVDEVHMLSKGAFNALLKTLEEPPKHLIFILATTEPERLPQTILSRCQRFDFKRITNKDLFHNMKNITEEVGVEVEDEVLNLISRNSDGAMRDALSLLDQCISFNRKEIKYEDALNLLGIANKDIIFKMIDNVNTKDLEKSLFTIDEIIQSGKDIHQFIKDIINHFRNLMIVKSSKNPKDILDIDEIDRYSEQSKSISIEYILNALEIMNEAESQSKWSSEPRIMLEMAIIKLVKLEERLSLEERVKELENLLSNGEYPKTSKKVEPRINNREERPIPRKEDIPKGHEEPKEVEEEEKPKEPERTAKKEIIDDGSELSVEQIKKDWDIVKREIKSKKINIYALIMEGEVLSYENNLLTIGYDEGFGFHKEAISGEKNKKLVEEIVSGYFNKNIALRFIMKGSKIKEEPKKKDNSDSIKRAQDFFGEDILEIK